MSLKRFLSLHSIANLLEVRVGLAVMEPLDSSRPSSLASAMATAQSSFDDFMALAAERPKEQQQQQQSQQQPQQHHHHPRQLLQPTGPLLQDKAEQAAREADDQASVEPQTRPGRKRRLCPSPPRPRERGLSWQERGKAVRPS